MGHITVFSSCESPICCVTWDMYNVLYIIDMVKCMQIVQVEPWGWAPIFPPPFFTLQQYSKNPIFWLQKNLVFSELQRWSWKRKCWSQRRCKRQSGWYVWLRSPDSFVHGHLFNIWSQKYFPWKRWYGMGSAILFLPYPRFPKNISCFCNVLRGQKRNDRWCEGVDDEAPNTSGSSP